MKTVIAIGFPDTPQPPEYLLRALPGHTLKRVTSVRDLADVFEQEPDAVLLVHEHSGSGVTEETLELLARIRKNPRVVVLMREYRAERRIHLLSEGVFECLPFGADALQIQAAVEAL